MDEVSIVNPNCRSPIDLLGKAPFILNGDIFPWSELDSQDVNLIVCVNPESQDLAQIHNLEEETLSLMKQLKPEQGPVPTIPMWRVFRCSKAIQSLIQELQRECSSIHREFGYQVPPNDVKEGHEITGKLPVWIEAPEHQHMKCSKSNCKDCFLLCIEKTFQEVINGLHCDGIPNEDILVILTSSALTKDCQGTFEKEFLKSKHPDLNIRSNFQFDGCEAKVLIVIRNGGLLSFSLSNAISRAVSRLIIFSPDDQNMLERCCQKHLLVHHKNTNDEYKNMKIQVSDVKYHSKETQTDLDEKNSNDLDSSSEYLESRLKNLELQNTRLNESISNSQISPLSNRDIDTSRQRHFSTPWSTRPSSPSRPTFSITDESRSSSLMSMDSGLAGTKHSKQEFPQLEMKDSTKKLNPNVQKAISQVQAAHGISENKATEILVDFANSLFGQYWEK